MRRGRHRETEQPAAVVVRGCGKLRAHDRHVYTTIVNTFSCPGIESASEAVRELSQQLTEHVPAQPATASTT